MHRGAKSPVIRGSIGSGAAKESNLPSGGLPRPAGFEDRMGHQTPAAPRTNLVARARVHGRARWAGASGRGPSHNAGMARAEVHAQPAEHTHGLVPDAVKRSREGLRAVGASLAILGVTAAVQGVIYVLTDSVALLADLIHNAGDAL